MTPRGEFYLPVLRVLRFPHAGANVSVVASFGRGAGGGEKPEQRIRPSAHRWRGSGIH